MHLVYGKEAPTEVKAEPRMELIASAARSIAWMARWNRDDRTVINELQAAAVPFVATQIQPYTKTGHPGIT